MTLFNREEMPVRVPFWRLRPSWLWYLIVLFGLIGDIGVAACIGAGDAVSAFLVCLIAIFMIAVLYTVGSAGDADPAS